MDTANALIRQLLRTIPKVLSGAQSPLIIGESAEAFTLSQTVVIMALAQRGPASVSQLAADLKVSVPTASGIVDRLEKRKLIERRHGAVDRRTVEVHLTDKGQAAALELFGAMKQRWQALIYHLTDEEKAQFAAILRKIEEAI